MKLIYLFSLLALMAALPGRAQVPGIAWQQAYGTAARNERGGLAVAVPGGGFLIAGQQLLPGTAARSQVYLARTNDQGDTLWTRRFVPPLSLQPWPSGLAIDAQGNVLLAVSSVYSATIVNASHLIKFDPSCTTVIWQNLYQQTLASGQGGSSNILCPIIAADGNCFIMRYDIFDYAQSVAFRYKLLKVNAATGSQMWDFDFSQYSVAAGFSPEMDVTYLAKYAGGVMVHLGMYDPATQAGAKEYLFINQNGTVDYFKRRANSFWPSDNLPVFQTARDGNILVARRQKIYKISTARATAGDTLWYTVAPQASNYRDWDARDMVEDVDGNILLVGDSRFVPPGGPGTTNQIHLVRFTGRGVLVQDTILRRAGDNFARSALLGPTGRDLIFSGYATVGTLGGEDMLMARYTGFRPLAAVAPAGATAGPPLSVYPNPAGGGAPVWVEVPGRQGGVLRVFDALGRQVGQQGLEAGHTAVPVAVAALPAGVYVLRFTPAGGGLPRTTRLVRE